MGSSFEKILEKKSLEKSGDISRQKGVSSSGEKDELKRREKEPSVNKEKKEMDKILTGLSVKFSRLENAKELDKITGKAGISKGIADYLWKLSGEIWKDDIEVNESSNAKEIFRSAELKIFAPLERIRNNKKTECDIAQEVNIFKEYVDLLRESQIFKKAEFGLEDGYLETIEEYNSAGFRLREGDYIERCAEIIKNRHN